MVTVVCASEGYPSAPRTGDVISGIDAARAMDGVEVFCAGVAEFDGTLVTSGGRVLDVTGRGATIDEARRRAMAGVAPRSSGSAVFSLACVGLSGMDR